MNSLLKWLIPIVVLVALMASVAMPAMAQGPTATPTATTATVPVTATTAITATVPATTPTATTATVPVTATTAITATVPATTTTAITTTVPVTAPTPTGKTVGDSLPLTCDWTYMPPAPAPGYYSDLFYRVPYQKSTQLVIYISAVPKATNPDSFRFDVYTPYGSTLRYLFDEATINTWDNWVGDAAGSSTPNKYELGDLSWSGMLNAGVADGYYTMDVLNFNTTAVWFNLCSRSYINIR
jgi:hypothetical protein